MKKISYNILKNYFEQIVKSHRHIAEFVGYFSRELHHKQGDFDGIQSPYLALFEYQLGLDGEKMNTMGVRKLGFAIMRCDVSADDFVAQYSAIDECEALALSIISRIQFDNNNKTHFMYNSFLKNTVRILPVELSSQSFGVEVFLHLKNPQEMKLLPEDWADIDSVC